METEVLKVDHFESALIFESEQLVMNDVKYCPRIRNKNNNLNYQTTSMALLSIWPMTENQSQQTVLVKKASKASMSLTVP